MRLFKIGSLILAIVLTAGCIKANSTLDGVNGGQADLGNATFLITDVKGEAYDSSNGTQGRVVTLASGAQRVSNWNVPYEANYTFTACVQDRATYSRASGHRFEVETADARHRRVATEDIRPTDPEGCFTWIETIPFSYFVKRGKWVEIERDIIGSGVHTGRQRVRLAINPWLGLTGEHGHAVVYMRNTALPKDKIVSAKAADAALSGDSLGQAELYVEDVDIQNLRRAEGDMGTMFRMNVSMEPVVHVEDSAGVMQSVKLNTGDFDVIAHLVLAQTGPAFKDHLILTSFGESTISDLAAGKMEAMAHGRVIDGKLVAHIDAWSNVQMPQGNLQVALKIIPRGMRGLKSFEGIYDLGSERSLASGGKGGLTEECRQSAYSHSENFVAGGCSIASYLRSSANFAEKYQSQLKNEQLQLECSHLKTEDLSKDPKKKAQCQEVASITQHDVSSNSPYLFANMNLRFGQVDDHETTMQRWVDYTVSTCVTDRFTGERVVGVKFNIRYEDESGEVIHAMTQEDGCLNWSSKIFHKYYQPEQYYRKIVSIEKDTGFKRELAFRINPWDDKFTFGFDERQFTAAYWKKQDERKKIRSRFFLADFGYHTVRFQYNIDQLMNLEVRKTVLMELDPRVLRYSGIINARKMTEGLRDGLWLLKVAIQKNYLDPSTVGVSIDALKDDQAVVRLYDADAVAKERAAEEESRRLNSLKLLRELNIRAPSREFISTQTALVRSTDGVVIQPVELKMQDLRMMRVRSNFLVELQAVDETKLQVHNQLDNNFSEYINGLMKQRREKEERRRQNLNQGQPNPEDAVAEARKEKELQAKVEKRKDIVKKVFDYLVGLKYPISSAKTSLEDFKLSPEDQQFVDDNLSGNLDNLGVGDIDKALIPNNFIEIHLPSCQEIDCEALAAGEEKDVVECEEKAKSSGPLTEAQKLKCEDLDMGLNRRTFVGPVIFLSNGYKDSIRATDNLDEAMCGKPVDIVDPVEAQFNKMEHQLFATTEQKMMKERQNTIYRFSEYFGSLRHLCNVQVDALIEREKETRQLYEDNIEALASVYNFVSSFNMNFLSLADERPKAVELSPDSLKRCNNNLTSCMHETEDRRFPLQEAMTELNSNVSRLKPWFFTRWFTSDIPKSDTWDIDDVRNALFAEEEATSPKARRFAGCVLMAGSVAHDLRLKGIESHPGMDIEGILTTDCMNRKGAIVFDQKLRVFETGQTGDSYMFLGGFQVNLNVGQSFSVARSKSSSWSWGMEASDWVGAYGSYKGSKNLSFLAVKPFSLKIGQSTSLGSSEGTSVSDSTYLVAQIAKFRVRLDKYEKCVAMHYAPDFQDWIAIYKIPKLTAEDTRGLFVCEGQINRNQRFVDEKYFYFTQHFTEGDMLDQADLYNHPWLMALRGQRDFETFVGLMRAQEVASMWNFVKGIANPTPRPTEWPLAHMREAYKQITPTFPGFYTVLSESERGPDFPLEEKRLKRDDDDLNHEVINNPDLMQDRRSDLIHQGGNVNQ